MFYVNRFKDIEKQEYELEVVTPLFLGGADPKKAELRVPPIKAALRFWWRALYGSNEIAKMAESESEIFGSTEQKSTLIIQVTSKELSLSQEKLDRGNFNIYEYLGYGYRVGNDIKGYFVDGRFKIQLHFKKAFFEEITNSLGFLIYYGGLGSKSRNGFGCLHSKQIQPPVLNNFKKGPLKTFTAMSAQALLFDAFDEKPSWKEAIAEVGEAYKNGRFELKNSRMDRSLIAKPFARDHSRHAKPYFLHVNKVNENRYKGHILYLPYEYYDERKRQNYIRTCQKMNESLEQYAGGAK